MAKARSRLSGSPDKRLKGSAGVKQRRLDRARHPLCERCLERNRIVPTEVIDHVLPLAHGGTNSDDNKRGLCRPCHNEVSAEQFGYRKRPTIGVDGWPIDDTPGGVSATAGKSTLDPERAAHLSCVLPPFVPRARGDA